VGDLCKSGINLGGHLNVLLILVVFLIARLSILFVAFILFVSLSRFFISRGRMGCFPRWRFVFPSCLRDLKDLGRRFALRYLQIIRMVVFFQQGFDPVAFLF